MSNENDFKISKTIISKEDKTEKKKILKVVKNFLKTRTHTRKIHNAKPQKTTKKTRKKH
jgi:hypothetical protein